MDNFGRDHRRAWIHPKIENIWPWLCYVKKWKHLCLPMHSPPSDLLPVGVFTRECEVARLVVGAGCHRHLHLHLRHYPSRHRPHSLRPIQELHGHATNMWVPAVSKSVFVSVVFDIASSAPRVIWIASPQARWLPPDYSGFPSIWHKH